MYLRKYVTNRIKEVLKSNLMICVYISGMTYWKVDVCINLSTHKAPCLYKVRGKKLQYPETFKKKMLFRDKPNN